MTACNGSPAAECLQLEEEEEFMMDSEEHRRILSGTGRLILASLDPQNPACGRTGCGGGYLVNA
ncbi:hypothetical protein Tco_1345363, partial [Tanacetum coccineum]